MCCHFKFPFIIVFCVRFLKNKIDFKFININSKQRYQKLTKFSLNPKIKTMRKRRFSCFVIILLTIILSSCSVSNHSMKTPNYHIEFYKSDFEYSRQVTAEATSVRVLGIDWNRLFKWETGEIISEQHSSQSSDVVISGNFMIDPVEESFSTITAISAIIPVLGDQGKGKVSSYALYNLMKENPGYDVVIYPQFESKKFIVPVFYSKRVVQVTARLGKIK